MTKFKRTIDTTRQKGIAIVTIEEFAVTTFCNTKWINHTGHGYGVRGLAG